MKPVYLTKPIQLTRPSGGKPCSYQELLDACTPKQRRWVIELVMNSGLSTAEVVRELFDNLQVVMSTDVVRKHRAAVCAYHNRIALEQMRDAA